MDRNRDCGVVCIYVQSDLASNIWVDLDYTDLETLWVDIVATENKPYSVWSGLQTTQTKCLY